MFKLSKKHLQVRARTWRPPQRDELYRNRYLIPNPNPNPNPTLDPDNHDQAIEPIQDTHPTTTVDQPIQTPSQVPEPHPPPAPSPSPPPPLSQLESIPPRHPESPHQTSTYSHQEPIDIERHSFHSQLRTLQDPQAPLTRSSSQPYSHRHRQSIYSQSLNDAHHSSDPPTRSRPSSQFDFDPSQALDRLSQSNPVPQAYLPPQSDSLSNRIPETSLDLHALDTGSQHAHQSTIDHSSSSAYGPDQIQRPRITEEEPKAARKRLEQIQGDAKLSDPQIFQHRDHQPEPLYNNPELNNLSHADALLRRAQEQIELREKQLKESRQLQENWVSRERELALRAEEAQKALELERINCEERVKLTQEAAEREVREKIQQQEAERARQLEELQRDVERKAQLDRQELEETRRRVEEQIRLQYEADLKEMKRKEEEAMMEREMERVKMEDKLRAEQHAQYLAEENAKLGRQAALRAMMKHAEDALQDPHINGKLKRADLIAYIQPYMARNFNSAPYADVCSSPALTGYSPPSFPPTPMSPHLVPEQVQRAAHARQEYIEKQKRINDELRIQQNEAEEQARIEQQRQANAAAEQSRIEQQRREYQTAEKLRIEQQRQLKEAAEQLRIQAEERARGIFESDKYHRHQLEEDQLKYQEKRDGYPHRERRPSVNRSDQLPRPDGRLPGSTRTSHMNYPVPQGDRGNATSEDQARPDKEAIYRELEKRRELLKRLQLQREEDQSSLQEEREKNNSARPLSTHGRVRPTPTDERMTVSARTTLTDQPTHVSELSSSVQSAHNNQSSQQPGNSTYKDPDHVLAMLTEKEAQKRQAEEADLARCRADLAQAEAQVAEQQANLQESSTTASERHPTGRTDVSSVAKMRGAEVAAQFMARHSLPKSRRYRTSLSHANHPRTVPHHQRFHSIETSSSGQLDTNSDSGSFFGLHFLDQIPGYTHEVVKEIESSVMLPVEQPSPIEYLENELRGRKEKLKGEQLACKSLTVIAMDLGANAILSLSLPPPVLVDAIRVNFSAKGVAVILKNPAFLKRSEFANETPTPHHAPVRSFDDSFDFTHHTAVATSYAPKEPPTPAFSLRSEPFDHSAPAKMTSKCYHSSQSSQGSLPSQSNEYETSNPIRQIKKSIIASPRLPPLNSPGDSHRSITTSPPNPYDSYRKPTDIPNNQRDHHSSPLTADMPNNQRSHYSSRVTTVIPNNRQDHNPPRATTDVPNNQRDHHSPRTIKEEKYIPASKTAEKSSDLPIPPMFVTPKVTVQSPSDTTSPLNNSYNTPTAHRRNSTASPSMSAVKQSSPIKQSTSIARSVHSPRTIHEAVTFPLPYEISSAEKTSVSPQIDSTFSLPTTAAPLGSEESSIPTGFALTSLVTNTDSIMEGVQDFGTGLNTLDSLSTPSNSLKSSPPHQSDFIASSQQQALRGSSSIAPERRQQPHYASTSRATSRTSRVSNLEKFSTILPSLPSTGFLPEELSYTGGSSCDLNRSLEDVDADPRLPSRNRSLSQTLMKKPQHGKSDSTHTVRSQGPAIMRVGLESEPQVPMLTEHLVRSNSYPLNRFTLLQNSVYFSSPASFLQNENTGSENLLTRKRADSKDRDFRTRGRSAKGPTTLVITGQSPPNLEKQPGHEAVQTSIMHSVEDKIKNIVAQVSSYTFQEPASAPITVKERTPFNPPSGKTSVSEKLAMVEASHPSPSSSPEKQRVVASTSTAQAMGASTTQIKPENLKFPNVKFCSPMTSVDPETFSPFASSVGGPLNFYKLSDTPMENSVNYHHLSSTQEQGARSLSPPKTPRDQSLPCPDSRQFPSPESSNTPVQIPLPPITPGEKSLPPPTPREFPLPDSPVFYSFKSGESSNLKDFKNQLLSPKLQGERPSLSHIISDQLFNSPKIITRDDGDRFRKSQEGLDDRVNGNKPLRFSDVWIGDNWDVLLGDIQGLKHPITPVPALFNPNISSKNGTDHDNNRHDHVKGKINSIPLIQFSE